LEFVDYFGITGHSDVCKDFVEVRYNTSLALTGARSAIALIYSSLLTAIGSKTEIEERNLTT